MKIKRQCEMGLFFILISFCGHAFANNDVLPRIKKVIFNYYEKSSPGMRIPVAELTTITGTQDVKFAARDYVEKLFSNEKLIQLSEDWYRNIPGDRDLGFVYRWKEELYFPILAKGIQMLADDEILFLKNQMEFALFSSYGCAELPKDFLTTNQQKMVREFSPNINRYFSILEKAFLLGMDNQTQRLSYDKKIWIDANEKTRNALGKEERIAFDSYDSLRASKIVEDRCKAVAAYWMFYSGTDSVGNIVRRHSFDAQFAPFLSPTSIVKIKQ